MSRLPLIVLGAGGHARVLIDALRILGREIIGVTAPQPSALPWGIAYLGTDDIITEFEHSTVELVNGVGSVGRSGLRERLFTTFKQRGYRFTRVRHPTAVIASDVEEGEGVQIMAGAVIQTGTRLDEDVIVNTRASVDHDCRVGAHVHIAPGVVLSGGVQVGASSHIGTGAAVIQNIHIGLRSVVGAGAVVVRDVQSEWTVVGNPAKRIRIER